MMTVGERMRRGDDGGGKNTAKKKKHGKKELFLVCEPSSLIHTSIVKRHILFLRGEVGSRIVPEFNFKLNTERQTQNRQKQ